MCFQVYLLVLISFLMLPSAHIVIITMLSFDLVLTIYYTILRVVKERPMFFLFLSPNPQADPVSQKRNNK